MEMDLVFLLIGVALGIVIQYFIIKVAVRNGTIEAQAQTFTLSNSQMKQAIKAAISESEKEFLIGLHNTIQDAIKASTEQNPN